MTRSRPQIPRYDGPSFRRGTIAADDTSPRDQLMREQAARAFSDGPEGTTPPRPAPVAPATPPATGGTEPGLFRLRDFSPEGSRRARAEYTNGTPQESKDLDYFTQSRFAPADDAKVDEGSAPQPENVSPAAAADVPQQAPIEYTMTRRELRALQAAAEAEAAAEAADALPESITTIMASGPIILPSAGDPGAWADHMREFAAPSLEAPDIEVRSDEEHDSPDESTSDEQDEPTDIDAIVDQLAELQSESPDWESKVAPPALVEPSPFAGPAPLTGQSYDEAMAEFDALTKADLPAERAEEADELHDSHDEQVAPHDEPVAPHDEPETPAIIAVPSSESTSSTDVFHWAAPVQENDDDDDTHREVFVANELVLPTLPESRDIGHAVSGTGEILITGSMELPRGLGSTGGNPDQFDPTDIDQLIDAADREFGSTDSQPVRAVRAVSTHTGTQGMVTTKKPGGNHTLTILVVSASVMAVGVVGLLIAGMVFGIF